MVPVWFVAKPFTSTEIIAQHPPRAPARPPVDQASSRTSFLALSYDNERPDIFHLRPQVDGRRRTASSQHRRPDRRAPRTGGEGAADHLARLHRKTDGK